MSDTSGIPEMNKVRLFLDEETNQMTNKWDPWSDKGRLARIWLHRDNVVQHNNKNQNANQARYRSIEHAADGDEDSSCVLGAVGVN